MPQIAPPPQTEIETMLGAALPAWNAVNGFIEAHYEMETLWSTGGKFAKYEYKYRRGGKTLCALYPREGEFGFMVILGAAEREKFEAQAASFSAGTLATYRETKTYHDGLWLMLMVQDEAPMEDIKKLLPIKRRFNRAAAD